MEDISPLLKEHYLNVHNRIRLSWGSKHCRELLLNLLADSRDGQRKGFDPDAAKEIVALLNLHDQSFPQFDTTGDIIPPFIGSGNNRLRVTPTNDGGWLINIIAKCVVVVLIFGFFIHYIKKFI